MLELLSANWLCALLALVLGLLTAWWAWGRTRRPDWDASVDAPDERTVEPEPLPRAAATIPPAPRDYDPAPPQAFVEPVPAAAPPRPKPAAAPRPAAPKPRAVEPAPVRAVPKPAPKPRPTPPAEPATLAGPRIRAAVGAPDDLHLIKGVGPKLGALLTSLGVLRFDQIAGWTRSDIDEVDGYLGAFKGRVDRDNWVDQANYLAKGDIKGFEAKYGQLGSEIGKA